MESTTTTGYGSRALVRTEVVVELLLPAAGRGIAVRHFDINLMTEKSSSRSQKSIIFNGDNYTAYMYDITTVITSVSYCVAYTLDPDLRMTKPAAFTAIYPDIEPTEAAVKKHFDDAYRKIYTHIRATQSDRTATLLDGVRVGDGEKALEVLQQTHQPHTIGAIHSLLEYLLTMKQGDKKISALAGEISEKLRRVELSVVDTGKTIYDVLGVICMMRAVNGDHSLQTAILTSMPSVTLADTVRMYNISEERHEFERRTESGGSAHAAVGKKGELSNQDTKPCARCKNPHHSIATCYEEHPELRAADRKKRLERTKDKAKAKAARDEESDSDSRSSDSYDSLAASQKSHRRTKGGTKSGKKSGASGGRAWMAKVVVKSDVSSPGIAMAASIKRPGALVALLDSGTTHHCLMSCEGVTDFDPSRRVQVEVAQGSLSTSIGTGNAGKLRGALILPDFTENLASESVLINEGYEIVKSRMKGLLIRKDDKTVYTGWRGADGLFYIDIDISAAHGLPDHAGGEHGHLPYDFQSTEWRLHRRIPTMAPLKVGHFALFQHAEG